MTYAAFSQPWPSAAPAFAWTGDAPQFASPGEDNPYAPPRYYPNGRGPQGNFAGNFVKGLSTAADAEVLDDSSVDAEIIDHPSLNRRYAVNAIYPHAGSVPSSRKYDPRIAVLSNASYRRAVGVPVQDWEADKLVLRARLASQKRRGKAPQEMPAWPAFAFDQRPAQFPQMSEAQPEHPWWAAQFSFRPMMGEAVPQASLMGRVRDLLYSGGGPDPQSPAYYMHGDQEAEAGRQQREWRASEASLFGSEVERLLAARENGDISDDDDEYLNKLLDAYARKVAAARARKTWPYKQFSAYENYYEEFEPDEHLDRWHDVPDEEPSPEEIAAYILKLQDIFNDAGGHKPVEQEYHENGDPLDAVTGWRQRNLFPAHIADTYNRSWVRRKPALRNFWSGS